METTVHSQLHCLIYIQNFTFFSMDPKLNRILSRESKRRAVLQSCIIASSLIVIFKASAMMFREFFFSAHSLCPYVTLFDATNWRTFIGKESSERFLDIYCLNRKSFIPPDTFLDSLILFHFTSLSLFWQRRHSILSLFLGGADILFSSLHLLDRTRCNIFLFFLFLRTIRT
jgi:hypothetical protein